MDKLFWILLIVTLTLFILYLPINSSDGATINFKTRADDLIPLWTPFLLIYISYFIFVVFTFIFFVRSKLYPVLKIALLAIIISCSSAYLFYLFFQNGVARPVIVNNSFFDLTYTWINSWVAPYNAFPSLHVAISTICTIAFWKVKSKLFNLILIWAILIIVSTVLTKQHYFLDVIAGLALGFFSFRISGYFLKKYALKSDRITP